MTFASGDPELAQQMFAEIQRLVPDRRHVLIKPADFSATSTFQIYRQLRRRFRAYRIGQAPLLLDPNPRYRALRRAAFLYAPTKILAYNTRLERHQLSAGTPIASFLFVKGVPLDRIFLRPKWLVPWKKDRSIYPAKVQEIEGRPMSPRRRRVGVISPYFPFPLAHGGAVRIFNLLREMSDEFDIFLFAFSDRETIADLQPVLDLCARVILVDKPRYREPRWSTLAPPEVHEFRSPAMLGALARVRAQYKIEALQVEYTMLAPYAGDVLVEHDVTFALYRQIRDRAPGISGALGLFPLAAIREEMDRALPQKWWSCRSRIARCSTLCSTSRTSPSSPTAWILRDSLPRWSARANACCSSDRSGIFQISLPIDSLSNKFGLSCANILHRSPLR